MNTTFHIPGTTQVFMEVLINPPFYKRQLNGAVI